MKLKYVDDLDMHSSPAVSTQQFRVKDEEKGRVHLITCSFLYVIFILQAILENTAKIK